MGTSKFLSKVLGLYFILVSSAMLIDMPRFITSVTGLINNAPLLFVCGFFTLILGLLMVVSHNIWQLHWRVIITVLGWVVLLKGMCLLFCPQMMDHASQFFVQNNNVAY